MHEASLCILPSSSSSGCSSAEGQVLTLAILLWLWLALLDKPDNPVLQLAFIAVALVGTTCWLI